MFNDVQNKSIIIYEYTDVHSRLTKLLGNKNCSPVNYGLSRDNTAQAR